ncbi:MAG: hypothetical protein NTV69_08630 [Caldilinea sp.]|nr:hypothetical protein [Caldilinea sp.]
MQPPAVRGEPPALHSSGQLSGQLSGRLSGRLLQNLPGRSPAPLVPDSSRNPVRAAVSARFLIIAFAVEIIENDGIKTSEFFFKFKDFTAISNAAVPLETVTPNFLLLKEEKFLSNNFTNFPSEEIQFVEMHSLTYFFSNACNFGVLTGIKFIKILFYLS